MRAKKIFCVVAYDIADDRRRDKVIKIIEKYGIRINYSVFECFFTDSQFNNVKESISKQLLSMEDRVVYYPMCLSCYSKIVYQPSRSTNSSVVKMY